MGSRPGRSKPIRHANCCSVSRRGFLPRCATGISVACLCYRALSVRATQLAPKTLERIPFPGTRCFAAYLEKHCQMESDSV
jgi:hypothetical protein